MNETNGSLDGRTQSFVQQLHDIWSRQASPSAYIKLRDGLLSQQDQLETHIVTLSSVAKIACPAGLDGDTRWQKLLTLASQIEGDAKKRKRASNGVSRLRNLALIETLWSPRLVLYYGWDKVGQVQMSAIRACATRYPRFREDLTPRLNGLLLKRHREGIITHRCKTLVEASLQPLRDLNVQLLAETSPDQHAIQEWVKSEDGRVAVEEDGPLLNEVRPNHYHMYLLHMDRYGLIAARKRTSIMANDGLIAYEEASTNSACPGDTTTVRTSTSIAHPLAEDSVLDYTGGALWHITSDDRSAHFESSLCRSDSSTSSTSPTTPGPAAPIESRIGKSVATLNNSPPQNDGRFRDCLETYDISPIELSAPQECTTDSLSFRHNVRSQHMDHQWPDQSYEPLNTDIAGPEESTSLETNNLFDVQSLSANKDAFCSQTETCVSLPGWSEVIGDDSSAISSPSTQLGTEYDHETSSITIPQTYDKDTLSALGVASAMPNEAQYLSQAELGYAVPDNLVIGAAQSEHSLSDLFKKTPRVDRQPIRPLPILPNSELQTVVTTDEAFPKQLYNTMIPSFSNTTHNITSTVTQQQMRHVYWPKPDARWATIFTQPESRLTCGQARSEYEAEVLYYTSEEFIAAAQKGHIFRKPVVIKERFSDSNMHTAELLALQLYDRSAKSTLDARRLDGTQPMQISLETIADSLRTGKSWDRATVMSFRNITKCQRPLLTMLPRFRLLDYLTEREQGTVDDARQGNSLPPSIEDRMSFNICGLSGASSDALLSSVSGAWIRVLDGAAIWMVIPQEEMNEEWPDCTDQRNDGVANCQQRLVLLQQDDVLLLSPGLKIVQAIHSPTTTIMEGGLLWDERNIMETLRCISSELEKPTSTQSVISRELSRIIENLVTLVTNQPDRFRGHSLQAEFIQQFKQRVSYITSMRCDCSALSCRIFETCPCRQAGRACTLWCMDHSASSDLDCVRQTNVNLSDDDLVAEFMRI